MKSYRDANDLVHIGINNYMLIDAVIAVVIFVLFLGKLNNNGATRLFLHTNFVTKKLT